ncbi:c-type cytochrome [Pandoraea sp.]|uniref:c-type cytochrome n=1 Tax=Pandoraea sp. TaxID=1883445 RepID=UPI0011F81E42|nr:c-type cytochrome [Pandoraea sp.]MBU6491245.1 cytochrome c4 [Burkholderiales bacterium]MDE2288565.1 cytochrome c4 [Burkholderiales bacterium]MDE2611033.1 cytochrome c4 [Burkholderiales bacterium]TAL53739.1 MAG: cytochrome c4 [Pandoraea sp.]TAM16992.1 MAG: cytochrome c4 [Pandoraea sp.]
MNRVWKFLAIAPLALTLAALAGSAWGADAQPPAKPDLNRGQAIATQVCAACHGADGNSAVGTYPKLAGQHAAYLYKQLKEFKSHARNNAIMMGMASALSDQDMQNVAAYFASQKEKPGFATDKSTVPLGQKIFRGGIAEKGVPACAACHGPTGAGIPTQYPRLGGQWAEYTQTQLVAFREGTRMNSVPMHDIASRLTTKEIQAVADYIAGLR